jgi:hypothetical protein
MPDIFISYAREDQQVAEALAKDLGARGYAVWWDAALVGSDDYYEVILEALNRAKAAIVIWTRNSARSRFVRDEARFALHYEKLVAAKEPSLELLEIPFGFQGQHTEDVNNREQIVRAIEKLGVKPISPLASPTDVSEQWLRLKTTGSAQQILAFLETDPSDADRQQALVRLKELMSEPKAQTREASAVVKSLTMSNWEAFWRGLTLRLPSFQLSAQGIWATVGMVATNILLLLLLVMASLIVFGTLTETQHPAVQAVPLLGFAVVAAMTWVRFSRLVDQRNFAAAIVVSIMFLFMLLFVTMSLFVVSGGLKLSSQDTGPSTLVVWTTLAVAAAPIVGIALIVRRIFAAR